MDRQAIGTHGLSGNAFANPTASSSATYAKHPFRIRDASPDRQLEKSFILSDGSSMNYVVDQQ